MQPEEDLEARERARLRALLVRAATIPVEVLQAVEFRAALPTKSRPSVLLCDDGHEYVVKGRNAGRSTYNDQVVGRLGMVMGAPVGQVALVEVPLDLILDNVEMRDLVDGVAHGSRLIPDTGNAERVLYRDVPENRARFALLALLYGLVLVEEDHQFIYQLDGSKRVFSVDHGDAFPRGPGWSIASLKRAPAPEPDRYIQFGCDLTLEELRQAAENLRRIDDPAVTEAVVAPPDNWGVTDDEDVALAYYLCQRRDQLLAMLTRQSDRE